MRRGSVWRSDCSNCNPKPHVAPPKGWGESSLACRVVIVHPVGDERATKRLVRSGNDGSRSSSSNNRANRRGRASWSRRANIIIYNTVAASSCRLTLDIDGAWVD